MSSNLDAWESTALSFYFGRPLTGFAACLPRYKRCLLFDVVELLVEAAKAALHANDLPPWNTETSVRAMSLDSTCADQKMA